MLAQFLSAFADNALLFAVVGMVMHNGTADGWYVPALQSAFLVAFVILAPWVGHFADGRPKPQVLLIGNTIKALGTGMILGGVEPLIGYVLVGAGAAVYGPAKYGILPELVGHGSLVKANGLIEGSTIAAIILGTVSGGRLADGSFSIALMVVLATYLVSAAATLLLPRLDPRGARGGHAAANFFTTMQVFFASARARFSMLGASLFWAAAAVLRVLLVAWAPLVLLMKNASGIAELTLFLALGTVAGAVLAPRALGRLRHGWFDRGNGGGG
jgi:LPLT family lysophospholipid transporter-like MFS transporter